jgi:hypothetical protein
MSFKITANNAGFLFSNNINVVNGSMSVIDDDLSVNGNVDISGHMMATDLSVNNVNVLENLIS